MCLPQIFTKGAEEPFPAEKSAFWLHLQKYMNPSIWRNFRKWSVFFLKYFKVRAIFWNPHHRAVATVRLHCIPSGDVRTPYNVDDMSRLPHLNFKANAIFQDQTSHVKV